MNRVASLLIALAIGVVAGLLVSGCTTVVGRFPLLSTKYNELSRVDLTQLEYHRGVTATDGRLWLFVVPLGGAPTIERAADACLAAGFGDFMTSARVEAFWWSFFGLVSWESYTVTGDVGNSLGAGARQVEAPVGHVR